MTEQLYINPKHSTSKPHPHTGRLCDNAGCIPYVPKTLIVPAAPTPNNQDKLMVNKLKPSYFDLPPHIWCRECMEAGCTPYIPPAYSHPQEVDKTIGHKSIEDTFPDEDMDKLIAWWCSVRYPNEHEYDNSDPWKMLEGKWITENGDV